MSNKSILVIDTPNSCEECILFSGYSCNAYIKQISCKTKSGKKPYWCPLSPIPERKTLRQYTDNTALNMESMLAYQYAQGWNDFRDKILEGN